MPRPMSLPAPAAASLILLLAPAAGGAQPAPVSPAPTAAVRKVRVAAGPEYRAAGLHRWLLGPNYRRLWTTPIEVEVLDVRRFAGGLRAEKKGGGKQTKSLRFQAADGREFRVRSVDKDPEQALPPEYRHTFVQWVAQDQISAANPAGPMVVDPLMRALGFLYVPHQFVVIPDEPALGEFRKEFAGMLGILEETPRLEGPVTPGFEQVEKLYDWDDLWPRMLDEGGPENRVDARAYLRARLLDMFIGDWDRHERQFRWARVKGQPLLQPVPEDRDQAFAKFDGALLAVARLGQSRFVNFEQDYPPAFGLNWAARFMDRRVLGGLEAAAWEEAAREVQAALTDAVLQEAVRRMPPEYYELIGPKMVDTLRIRRERLAALARSEYALMAREAEAWGTDRADVAEVRRNGDGTVEVSVSLAGADGAPGEPYFHRRYEPAQTREVRLFLLGGDDRVVSRGRPTSPIEVRVIGSAGDDTVDDSGGGSTHVYDAEGHNRVIEGPGTAYDDHPFVPEVDYLGDPLLDWSSSTGPALWLSAQPDVGLLLGLKLVRTSYGFRKYPYRYEQSVGVAYSTALGAWKGEYFGDFLRTNSRKRTQVLLRASDVELVRFHGFGNETVAPGSDEFYRAGQRQYLLEPRFRFGLEHVDWWVGPTVKFSHAPLRPDHFLTLSRPYGVGDFGEVGAGTSLLWDVRNHAIAATRGAMASVEGNYYPGLWSVRRSFGEVHGQAAGFFSPSFLLQPTFALRVGGKRVWGRYPFHEAAFLGGPDDLRGLAIQRYAGDASVWTNAELRLRLVGFKLLVPADLGVVALTDAGRVFLAGESSRRWHHAAGGGLWLSFLRRENTLSAIAARSEGTTSLYLGAGFQF